jgi:hypothetical protein
MDSALNLKTCIVAALLIAVAGKVRYHVAQKLVAADVHAVQSLPRQFHFLIFIENNHV